jgi:hypothetical protein
LNKLLLNDPTLAALSQGCKLKNVEKFLKKMLTAHILSINVGLLIREIDMKPVRVDIRVGNEDIFIRPIWSGVDRPDTGGWSVRLSDRKLAERLAKAILAGVVCGGGSIKTDNGGKTYVGGFKTPHILGRTMNADLKKLGF